MTHQPKSLRNMLRQILPPRVFRFVRLSWWYVSFYYPRLVTSWFVTRTPDVRGFGRDKEASQLLKQLQSVNTAAPTKMCRVMTRYGSDKGSGKHNYTTVYFSLLKNSRNLPLRIVELGLGSNNPNLPSSMGINGTPGASLRGWREIFPHALVYGADIDREILFQQNRIETFYCDQLNQKAIRRLWSQAGLKDGADVIIDDGLHTLEANVSFLEGSLDQLRPGGIYVIEDVDRVDAGRWHELLGTIYSSRYPAHEFVFISLPNPRKPCSDNNLIVIHREE